MALPNVPQEREQGAVAADAQLAAGAPPPLEPTPTQADQALVPNLGTAIPNTGTPTQAPTGPQPNMWRIPANYAGVLGDKVKTMPQRQEDVGLLWQALANDPRVSPMVRYIAETLMGARRVSS